MLQDCYMAAGDVRRKAGSYCKAQVLVEKLQRYGTRRDNAWITERIIIGHLEGSGHHRDAREGRFESGKW
jgi:hypothetical protein